MHAYECIGSIEVWNHPSFGGGRWSLEEFGGEGGGHLWDHTIIGSVKSLNRNHLLKPHKQAKNFLITIMCHPESIFILKTIFILKRNFPWEKSLFVKKNFYLENNYTDSKFHSL